MPTQRSRKPKLGPVSKYFVEAAKQIPEVQLIVFVDGEGDDRRIGTIIDAPRLDRDVRRRVYTLMYEANRQGEEEIDFRLINVHELQHGIAGLHIEGLPVLFQRTPTVA